MRSLGCLPFTLGPRLFLAALPFFCLAAQTLLFRCLGRSAVCIVLLDECKNTAQPQLFQNAGLQQFHPSPFDLIGADREEVRKLGDVQRAGRVGERAFHPNTDARVGAGLGFFARIEGKREIRVERGFRDIDPAFPGQRGRTACHRRQRKARHAAGDRERQGHLFRRQFTVGDRQTRQFFDLRCFRLEPLAVGTVDDTLEGMRIETRKRKAGDRQFTAAGNCLDERPAISARSLDAGPEVAQPGDRCTSGNRVFDRGDINALGFDIG